MQAFIQKLEVVSNVNEIANKIIWLYREAFGESPSHMKLQKLCYYAQGLFLAENDGRVLFQEDFEAWALGPVCRALYDRFKQFSYLPISSEIENPTLAPEIVAHLESIVTSYGRYDAAALSHMTHLEAPWKDARGGLPESANCSSVIPKESMKRFFKRQLAEVDIA